MMQLMRLLDIITAGLRWLVNCSFLVSYLNGDFAPLFQCDCSLTMETVYYCGLFVEVAS